MLPSAPKLYEYANESRFRREVGSALSANALLLASLRTSRNTTTPSGAIDFTIAGDGTVTMTITAISNALSVGYIVSAVGYDTDSSGQTLGSLATPLEVDLGVKAPGDVLYVTAWFYSAAAGEGDASEIASARKFDYNADVGPLSVAAVDIANNAVITRTILDGNVTFAKLDAMVFPTTYGGTGLSSFAQGDMLYYNAGALLSKLAHPGVANRVLTSTLTGPQWVASLTGVDTTGNAATATALQTARTIWGQSFNGTANVSGAFSGATTGEFAGVLTMTNSDKVQWGDSSVFVNRSGNNLQLGAANAVVILNPLEVTGNLSVSGAVTTGAWQATPVVTTYGGTGLASYTAGDMLYYSSGTTLSKLALGANTYVMRIAAGVPVWSAPGALTNVDDTNVTLTLGGSPSAALLAATSLTLGWTGTLAVTRGGTGHNGFVAGDILYATGASALGRLAIGANDTYLKVVGGTPTWSAVTVSSADTLTNTRTIWGQNFNGSANVSGALSGATTGTFSDRVVTDTLRAIGVGVITFENNAGTDLVTINASSGLLTALYGLQSNSYVAVNATSKVIFDSATGSQTFIYEVADNVMALGVGGSEPVHLRSEYLTVRHTSGVDGRGIRWSNISNSQEWEARIGRQGLENTSWSVKDITSGVVGMYITTGATPIVVSNMGRFKSDASAGGLGAAFQLFVSGSHYGGLFNRSVVTGTGTDYTPMIFAETGLGFQVAVNGSATSVFTIASTGALSTNAAATFAGTVTRTGATNSVMNGFVVQNTDSGTAAASRIQLLGNDGITYGALFEYGSGYTTSGVSRQQGLLLYNNGAGGVTVSTGSAAAAFRVYTASEVLCATFGSDQSFSLVGSSTFGASSDITASGNGTTIFWTVYNSSNTASSRARMRVRTAGSSSGAQIVSFLQTGVREWAMGQDTDSNFKIYSDDWGGGLVATFTAGSLASTFAGDLSAKAGAFSSTVSTANVLTSSPSHASYTGAALRIVVTRAASSAFYMVYADANSVAQFYVTGAGAGYFAGALETAGTIKTAAPTVGSAQAWKLGNGNVGTVGTPDRYINVEIAGTMYYIPASSV
jgi:hypothetical protein